MDVAEKSSVRPDGAEPTTQRGKVEVSPGAIATVVSRTVLQSYGIVGMATRNPLGELLRIEDRNKGVEVRFDSQHQTVSIDLYVIIEYGTRIAAVANNIMSTVKFAVESALAMPVAQINVHVQGIRVSK